MSAACGVLFARSIELVRSSRVGGSVVIVGMANSHIYRPTYLPTHTEGKPLASPVTGEAMAAVIVPHFTLRKLLRDFCDETQQEWAREQQRIMMRR